MRTACVLSLASGTGVGGPQRVLMFIDWLESSQENYDLYMYRVRGRHYVEKGDYIEPPEGIEQSGTFFYWNAYEYTGFEGGNSTVL